MSCHVWIAAEVLAALQQYELYVTLKTCLQGRVSFKENKSINSRKVLGNGRE
jgi:hypothetical protein